MIRRFVAWALFRELRKVAPHVCDGKLAAQSVREALAEELGYA